MSSPDEQAFLEDLKAPDFKLGVIDNKWKLEKLEENGPFAYISIFAAFRSNSPDYFTFRFKIDNYPAQAPEICIWDLGNECKLSEALRPTGPDNFKILFRTNWMNGDHLYAPYERKALITHPDWTTKYRELCWKAGDSVVKILNDLFRQLNSSLYGGIN